MKSILFGLMLFHTTAFAQSGWVLQNSGTTVPLGGVSFTDAHTGTVVGGPGMILRTTNAGETWTPQTSGTSWGLLDVAFINFNTGTTVGNNGTILRTEDGGATWATQSGGTTNTLIDMSFVDDNIGTIVGNGGVILRTTNGGSTWTTQPSGTTLPLWGVCFTDVARGTAVGWNGTILRTTNGGTTWTGQTSGTTEILESVCFVSADSGTVVGWNGTILRTTNGGNTWTSQSSGTTNHLYDVCFTDGNTGTVVGVVGTILRTTNGGATWREQTSGTINYLVDVSFTDTKTGTAVGYDGTILRTITGGEPFSIIRLVPSEIIFTDTLFVGEVTNRTLYVANDGDSMLFVYQYSPSPTFSSSDTVFSVSPRDSHALSVQFRPTSAGLHQGWLIFSSNDPLNPYDSVRCEGFAVSDATNPLAYYPFTGNASDSSGHGHHGTPEGNPALTTDRFGHVDGAYYFNGVNQRIDLPPSITIPVELSMSFWLRTTSVDTNTWPSARFIIDRDICAGARDWSVGLGRGGKIQFQTGTGSLDEVLNSSVDVNDNTWHHVVVIRDTSAQVKEVFIDGQLDTMESFDSQPFYNNNRTISIGATVCQPGGHKYYEGNVDDIRFYDRVLSFEEIQGLYHERGWAPAQVSMTSPVQNELNVSADGDIAVTFNDDMDPTTIDDLTFVVNARSTGKHVGAITYDDVSRTATFDPSTGFVAGDVVTVVLTQGIRSIWETPMQRAHCWEFTIAVQGGTARFTLDSSYAVGQSPYSPIHADFDNDGDPDIATANRNSGTISVLFNNGDGTFVPDSNYAVGSNPEIVRAADLDGDGDIDMATANRIFSGTIRVLLNDGAGVFTPQPPFPAHGSEPGTLWLADLDRDGDVDLISGNAGSNSTAVFRNDGSAAFAFDTSYTLPDDPSVAAADLDKDGDLDIAGGLWGSNQVYTLMNRGDGRFDSLSLYPVGVGPAFVLASDLNGDGYLDLSSTNHYDSTASVLLNNGDGTFATHVTYGVGLANYIALPADLDHDGDLDLIVPNRESDDVSVLLNNGDGTFATQQRFATGNGPISVTACDVDLDGDLDLITANTYSNDVSVLLNGPVTAIEQTEELPTEFALAQNYPNPFNPTTSIKYQLPVRSYVTLKVFDIVGREVRTLIDGIEEPGYRFIEFDAADLATGIYFYSLHAGGYVSVKKLIVLK